MLLKAEAEGRVFLHTRNDNSRGFNTAHRKPSCMTHTSVSEIRRLDITNCNYHKTRCVSHVVYSTDAENTSTWLHLCVYNMRLKYMRSSSISSRCSVWLWCESQCILFWIYNNVKNSNDLAIDFPNFQPHNIQYSPLWPRLNFQSPRSSQTT